MNGFEYIFHLLIRLNIFKVSMKHQSTALIMCRATNRNVQSNTSYWTGISGKLDMKAESV